MGMRNEKFNRIIRAVLCNAPQCQDKKRTLTSKSFLDIYPTLMRVGPGLKYSAGTASRIEECGLT